MKLAQAMKQIVPAVQDLKRRSLHQPDGETTMPATLIALRDDRVLAVVTAPRMVAVLTFAPTLAIGLDPQMLVVAAQANLPKREESADLPAQVAGEAIAYTTFTREKEASLAVQRYEVRDGQVLFAAPERGRPDDRTIMDQLARAMAHEPLDPGRVARKDPDAPGATAPSDEATDSAPPVEQSFIPEAEGRMAIDAGTVKAIHDKLRGIGGRALFLAADGVHATKMLAAGLPQECLLSGD
ncbi:MAG: hypothetical protein GX555_07925 [Actinomycetales bacterium]|nr:hypothetical protein [Actinomycetales bacterium]